MISPAGAGPDPDVRLSGYPSGPRNPTENLGDTSSMRILITRSDWTHSRFTSVQRKTTHAHTISVEECSFLSGPVRLGSIFQNMLAGAWHYLSVGLMPIPMRLGYFGAFWWCVRSAF